MEATSEVAEEKEQVPKTEEKEERGPKEERVPGRKVSIYDRFGRLVQKEKASVSPTKRSLLQKQTEARIELGREIKWIKMLKTWAKTPLKRPKKCLSRARKGVPDSVRGMAWWLFMGGDELCQYAEKYDALVSQESSHIDVIEADVNRTYSDYVFFRDSKSAGKSQLKEPLVNVLKAYAACDPDVGYCQGMSFHAGLFLMYVPENQCFPMLRTLLQGRPYGLRGLFEAGFPLLKSYLACLDKLLGKFCPRILAKLEEHNIPSQMFATDWFMTMFQSLLPFKLVLRIMDIYLLEGEGILFAMSVHLLQWKEAELKRLNDVPSLIQALQGLGKSEQDIEALCDTDGHIKQALAIGITTETIEGLIAKGISGEVGVSTQDS